MPSFTLPLKDVIRLTGGTRTIVNGISRIDGGSIGLGWYPLFNEAHRDVLNGKIVDHYWNREIGQETIEMFQLAMRRKMNEIMPPYNKLYLTELIKFDPLSTVDLLTLTKQEAEQSGKGNTVVDSTGKTVSSGAATNTTDSTSAGRVVGSEFPQVALQADSDYATNATDTNTKSDMSGSSTESGNAENEANQNTNMTQDSESKQDGESRTTGYQGAASDLLQKFRATIMNIDMMIIDELQDCFMMIWSEGQNMGERRYI